jgi:N-acetylmuramoyl-L-alanine amidase
MPREHKVKAGECVSSIAFENGFAPDTLWDHPANADLRARRGSGNVLFPGDVVVVPDLRVKSVEAITARRHVFRRKGVPEKLRVRVARDGEPRARQSYILEIGGERRTGTTDAEGRIDEWIPPDARAARLIFADEEFDLELGHLDPVTTDSGLRARLQSLGYLRDRDAESSLVIQAIERFQQACHLDVTLEPDDATRDKLVEVHGS